MAIELNLNDHGDRCVELIVTDKYNQVYRISCEFLNHDFEADEVQISCHKLPQDYKEVFERDHHCAVYSPNRVLHNEKTIDIKDPGTYGEGGTDDHRVIPNVWFEFHPIKAKSMKGKPVDLPAVLS